MAFNGFFGFLPSQPLIQISQNFTIKSLLIVLQQQYEAQRDTWALFAVRLIRWQEGYAWFGSMTYQYDIDEYYIECIADPNHCSIRVNENSNTFLWIDIKIKNEKWSLNVWTNDMEKANTASGYLSLMLA